MTPGGIGGIVSCRLADVAFSTRSKVASADVVEAAAVHCRRAWNTRARARRRARRCGSRSRRIPDRLRAAGPARRGPRRPRRAAARACRARSNERLRVRSATRPAPSVLSPSRPSLRSASVFTAPAISARGVRSRAIRHAACLCGTVTFNPLPPAAKNSHDSVVERFGRDFQARIRQLVAGLLGEQAVDERRPAVGDGITDDCVLVCRCSMRGRLTAHRSLRLQPRGGALGEVRQDAVGAGAADRHERFRG